MNWIWRRKSEKLARCLVAQNAHLSDNYRVSICEQQKL